MDSDNETRAIVKGNGSCFHSTTCPKCHAPIYLQAAVNKFMEPANWIFYGERGKRAIVCQGKGYTHFAVSMGNSKISNRLAWLESGR